MEFLEDLTDKNKNAVNEVRMQMAAGGDGSGNIIEMKGAIRSEKCVLTVTEFANGGELGDVVDKIKNTNEISEDNKKLLNSL